MAINTNAQNVIIGDSLVDYCTYQESASRYAIPGKNHMGQPMMRILHCQGLFYQKMSSW